MALTKIRLGDYIKRSTVNNKDLQYGTEWIAGVTNEGIFTTPKGNVDDVDLKPYKLVDNGAFVYNPTRLDLGSIAYRTEGFCIVSHLYMVFYLTKKGREIIDPLYLFIYFRRQEFCREVTFRNFGSQRPEFNFNDISNIIVPLPDIQTQHKYVAVYKSMLANQQSYERGLEDLKLVCDGYIEDLRRSNPCEKIGQYLVESDQRNTLGLTVDGVRGLATSKEMIATKADMDGVSLACYKVVHPGQIAYVPDTSRRGDKVSLGFNETNKDVLVSSISVVFGTKKEKLLSQYLMLFLTRTEFDRYARFNSWGSARETFSYPDMCDVMIPIPSIEMQQSISDIYSIYSNRKNINERLKAQIKGLCPILIRGSLDEGKRV